MKKLKWTFSLVDRMTKPAKTVEKALGGVEGKLEQVTKTADKVEKKKPFRFLDGLTATSPRAAKAVVKVTTAFEGLKKAFDSASRSSSPIAGTLGATAGALGGVTMAAVAAAGAVAAVGAGLIAGASFMAIKAASSRKDLLIGFEAVLGSGKAANKALDEASDLSAKIGITSGNVQKAYLDMLRLGVERRHAPVIAQGLADLAATMGDEREAVFGQLTDVVAKMSSSGKFDVAALKAVRTTLRTEDIEATLAKRLGVVPAQVQKMLQAGKVSADEGIAALLETIQTQVNQGGALGTTAAKVAGGIGHQWENLKSNFSSMFELVDISPLERAMAKMNEIFASERGQKMVEKINLVLGGLFGLIEKAMPSVIDWLGKGVDTLLWLIDKVQVVYKWMQKLFAGERLQTFIRGLKVIAAVIGVGLLTALTPILAMMGTITVAIGAATYALGYMAEIGFSALTLVWKYGFKLVDWFLGLKDRFLTIGSDIVGGLWEGIKSGWRWMLDKFKALLDLLPKAAKKALGIASPAKVMMPVGRWTMAGVGAGADDEADAVASKMRQLGRLVASGYGMGVEEETRPRAALSAIVAPPTMTASNIAGGRAAGASVNVVNNFHIDGSEDPRAIAEQIHDISIGSLASAFEQLSMQAGAT